MAELFDVTTQSPMLMDLVRVFRKNIKLYDTIAEKMDSKPIVGWANSGISAIYFRAFGIAPFFPQLFMHNGTEFAKNIEILEGKYGISNDLCSDNKIAVARCLIPEESSIKVPDPDFVVSMSMLCTHVTSNYDYIGKNKGIPHYRLQVPFMDEMKARFDKDYRLEMLGYYAEQVDHLTQKIENEFNVKFDEDRFRSAARTYFYCIALHEHLQKMNVNAPCPMDALDFVGFHQPIFTSDYTEDGNVDLLAFYIKFYNKLYEMVEKNKAAGAKREGLRIYWEGHTFVHRVKLVKEILSKYGAKTVFGSFMSPYLTEDRIWEFDLPYPLSKDSLEHVFDRAHVFDDRFDIDDFDRLSPAQLMARMLFCITTFKKGLGYRQAVTRGAIERFDLDAVIIITAQNCRFWSLPQTQLKDYLVNEMQMPCLALEADTIDERCISEAQLVTRLEAFLESIA